jgi:hypothetical protein
MRLIPLRIGTPVFMARLVRSLDVDRRGYMLHPMPQLDGFALDRYKACVNDRIDEFPENIRQIYWIPECTRMQTYSHRLSYDAESILWLLLWWAIQVQPEKGIHQNQIPEYVCCNLTGGQGENDPRHAFVNHYHNVCHPDYRGLDELLRPLFKQLAGYQEYVLQPAEAVVYVESPLGDSLKPQLPEERDATRMKDDYLHEAFQRTVLDFIVQNINEPFMELPISPSCRQGEAEGTTQSTRTPKMPGKGVKRNHAVMAGVGNSDPNKKYVFTHVSPPRR